MFFQMSGKPLETAIKGYMYGDFEHESYFISFSKYFDAMLLLETINDRN